MTTFRPQLDVETDYPHGSPIVVCHAYDISVSTDLAFATGLGRLYHGDSLEWLRSLDDCSVNLVVADPPYGSNAVHWDKFKSLDAYALWCEEWLRECHRVLTHDGSCFVCGWSENLAYLKVLGDEFFSGCRWLVWFYRNKQTAWKTDWGRSHESILHFRKEKAFKFHQDAIRIPYNEHTTRYPQHTQAASSVFGKSKSGKQGHIWRPHPLGAKPKDVFEISIINNAMPETTPHPTQKPEDLIRRLVLACSDKGDVVIDPFVGSGTTAVVCEKLERRWAAVDLELEYLQYAMGRLRSVEPNETLWSERYRELLAASTSNRDLVRSGRTRRGNRATSKSPQIEIVGLEDTTPEVFE